MAKHNRLLSPDVSDEGKKCLTTSTTEETPKEINDANNGADANTFDQVLLL
jgi:hypothetical protein